ncbi:MAG: (2Fe-2S)-binding protein [Dehalococcoidales bacterium]|nr:(2Fe-2S)-binding protein [Dehalococcoidales bacterium]
MKITIDGRELEFKEGQTILQVAQENNIYIPTLCYNEAVKAYGACRLCIVEVERRGRRRLVTSCLYPAEDGLNVSTNSERVKADRKIIMQLLLARCPNNEVVIKLAKKLGVETTPFKLEDKNCILCGLCVRVCEEVVGANAISSVARGVYREIAAPYYEQSDSCIGCGSCVYVCPINAITFQDKGSKRILTMPNHKMKKVQFKLKKCVKCGTYWAPEKQIEFICKTTGQPAEMFDLCPDCRD